MKKGFTFLLGIWWGYFFAGLLFTEVKTIESSVVGLWDILKSIAYIGVVIFMGIITYIELKTPNKL